MAEKSKQEIKKELVKQTKGKAKNEAYKKAK
jgi:hypothetical protein